MKINNKDSKRGRPRADDPKIKLTNVRLKTSTIIDIEVIAEQLDTTPSKLIRTILESEIKKFKEQLKIKVSNE
ncbi:hypothetical protein [Aliarcobacter cryaerophilus]|uniref:hypothetical protein n=1 Tax=Aliarcobacter cryaerophilus TaxID=28198 RepID=UPI0021B262A3|nr:hypothetical protein [Aliarcobacter cryaerophilus]MCT7498726.1 hypothetical protein [Aliarcobacter cryaerophilus]MCT7544377.1 hypothetical protein [Aliarcobacter cryaerophilus]